MLDGFLGRGFSSKCKSSIKLIHTRIEVIQKKRNAMTRHLKKDVADLLTRGQDVNAFKRVEALITEMNLLWGYDMIEQYCGCILNQLPSLQKQRECPPEAIEAVAGLMFAAARFADLPELRDLRAIFTERYGDALATSATDSRSNCSSVNQEFVEKVSSKGPSVDMKLQLMREISKELSINWDSKAFEQRISNQNVHHFRQHDIQGDKVIKVDCQQRQQGPTHGYTRQPEKVDRRDVPSTTSSYNRCPHDVRGDNVIKRENSPEKSIHRQPEPTLRYKKKQEKVENIDNPDINDAANDYPTDPIDNTERISREAAVNVKPNPTQNIMPPYVKPRSSNRYESTSKVRHVTPNNHEEPSDVPAYDERQVGSGPKSLGEHSNDERENTDNVIVGDAKPKPKSVRRKHLKPPVDRSGEETNDNEITRTTRRNRSTRDPRRSIPTINDDGGADRDDAIMDELLLHYSRKPNYEDNKMSVGTKKVGSHSHSDASAPPPSRAMSLPTEQMNSPKEVTKVHTRAVSMQPDMLNPSARHVHPKLPEYDDLAARIAALRKDI